MKEWNGCEKDSTLGERWEVGGYKLKRCPLKVVLRTGLEYIQAYKFYKQGLLPMQGGWMKQSQTFIQAIGIIDAEVEKIEEQVKKEQRNGKS